MMNNFSFQLALTLKLLFGLSNHINYSENYHINLFVKIYHFLILENF